MGLVDAVTAPNIAPARPHTPPTGTLPLSGVFGPTWQGEGPHTGRLVGFVRLGLCNLTCEWCDTPYTWDNTRHDVAAECPDTSVAAILGAMRAIRARTWVLSGGEPLMHSRGPREAALRELLTRYPREAAPHTTGWHVETNGTITPPAWMAEQVAHWTVSPKIGTRDPETKRLKTAPLSWFALQAVAGRNVAFKFVCKQPTDLHQVDDVVTRFGLPHEHVWVMPEGTDARTILARQAALAGATLEHGYNLTTRLHVLLWGNERNR